MVKPIILKGHDRPVSQVLFNREGDLLFSASKGKVKNCAVWFSETGERIGTYDGHAGAIFSMDVNFNSTLLLTASGDSSTRLWNVRTGEELCKFKHDTPAINVKFALGDKKFLTVTRGVMGRKPEILIYNLDNPFDMKSDDDLQPIKVISAESNFSRAFWGPLNENIYASDVSGNICVYDGETGELKTKENIHKKEITSLKFSNNMQYFVTASKDNTCKLIETKTLQCLKTFTSGRPLYDIAISPILPHVFVVGGQDVSTVTTSIADSVQFRARVFHSIYEKEIGSIHGHFAPVNSITINPTGNVLVTGGEDGYIRINKLDESYFEGLSDDVLFPIEVPDI